MSNCNSEQEVCRTQEGSEQCCAVEKSLKNVCCPVEQSIEMWQSAFFRAIRETQVDILKDKIRKAWGPMMEKEGDAIVEAMGTHWQSLMTQAKAQCDLRDKIQKIFESKGK